MKRRRAFLQRQPLKVDEKAWVGKLEREGFNLLFSCTARSYGPLRRHQIRFYRVEAGSFGQNTSGLECADTRLFSDGKSAVRKAAALVCFEKQALESGLFSCLWIF